MPPTSPSSTRVKASCFSSRPTAFPKRSSPVSSSSTRPPAAVRSSRPRAATRVPDDRRWRRSRYYVGSALLSRAHPSKLCFEVVCFTIDGEHPRAWVASFDNGDCSWRALPRDEGVVVDFDPWLFEGRCVHAAGKIYWHLFNSPRVLVLDPATLRFSYLPAPGALAMNRLSMCKYRIGETPDGRLCLVTDGKTELQLWVRGEGRLSDNGWLLERRIAQLSALCDMIPGMPSDPVVWHLGMPCDRVVFVWASDMDAGRTGKVFINTWGFGRYSYDLDTGKLERLSTESGKEYGHPMFAYFLAWPPAFLAPDLDWDSSQAVIPAPKVQIERRAPENAAWARQLFQELCSYIGLPGSN